MLDVIERIKELTRLRNWTEYRLRKESGLATSTIGNIFYRGSVPSISTLESLCDAFGISLCQFFAEGNAEGNFVSLTKGQTELLDKWALLSKEQQKAVLEFIDKMN